MSAPPVFLLGCQRSGTTLAGRLLASHPEAYFTVNGKLLYYLIVWIHRDPFEDACAHLRLDEIAHAMRRMKILGVTTADVDRMVAKLGTGFRPERLAQMSRRDAVRTLWLETFADLAPPGAFVGDKYNEYLLQLPEIQAIFPEARFLFLHRDPFDVAESMVRAFAGRPWAPSTSAGALGKWIAWNRAWLEARSEIAPARRLEIPYARLVAEPRSVWSEVCRFLEIESAPAFLDHAALETRSDRVGRGRDLHIDAASLYRQLPRLNDVEQALGYASRR